MSPLSTEVATALADVEISTRQLADAEERTRVAEAALATVQAELATLQAKPVRLFRRRRRRRVGSAATA